MHDPEGNEICLCRRDADVAVTRAFVAVVPPEPRARRGRARWPASTRPGVRRTTRAQWHVTLQFLGNGADIDAVGGGARRPVACTAATGAARRWRRVPEGAARVGCSGSGSREGAEAFAGVGTRGRRAARRRSGYEPEARAVPPAPDARARAKPSTDFSDAVAAIDARDAFGPRGRLTRSSCYESRAASRRRAVRAPAFDRAAAAKPARVVGIASGRRGGPRRGRRRR